MDNSVNFKLGIVVLCLVAFFSCSKDEESTSISYTSSPLLLKERRINNLLHSTYTYNENGLISTSTFYSANTGEEIFRDSYIYDVDTTIRSRIDLNTNENVYTRKYYNESEFQGRRDNFEEGEFVGYRYYNFKEDVSCGNTSILTYNTFGQLSTAVDFDYVDENCSYTATVSPTINSSFVDSEYTRGEKYGAYNSLRIPFLRIDKYSNINSYVKRNEDGDIIYAKSYRTEFEFNSQDHPIREIRTYLDGIIHNITFAYYE